MDRSEWKDENLAMAAGVMPRCLRDTPPPAEQASGECVADVIWRIDNEADQFIDADGMKYLRYLRDKLAGQQPTTGDRCND